MEWRLGCPLPRLNKRSTEQVSAVFLLTDRGTMPTIPHQYDSYSHVAYLNRLPSRCLNHILTSSIISPPPASQLSKKIHSGSSPNPAAQISFDKDGTAQQYDIQSSPPYPFLATNPCNQQPFHLNPFRPLNLSHQPELHSPQI